MNNSTPNAASQLDPARVVATIEQLSRRIEERFPDANLIQACHEILRLSKETERRAIWIGRPMIGLRITATALISLIAATLVGAFSQLKMSAPSIDIVQFVSLSNAAMSNVVLLAAAVYFVLTIETRVKRRRALRIIHELRSLAHVIDMHQLTKDPDRIVFSGGNTMSSPSNDMDVFETSRYLDYCSEMLAMIGKIASIYGSHWNDDAATPAVNEVEGLTVGLSQKIFQKVMILHGSLNYKQRTPY